MQMQHTLASFFEQEKQRAIDECTRCGLCVEMCPAIEHIGLADVSPDVVEGEVIDFLAGGEPNETVFARAFGCMECWKCTTDACPVGLDPLLTNEIVKWEYRKRGIVEVAYADQTAPDSPQRVLATVLASESDRERMFTPRGSPGSKYLFFPGCNIYAQPDKLLSVLDILDMAAGDYAFLPGLNNCCGNCDLGYGDINRASDLSGALVPALASYQPETVIFWCANCYIRVERMISRFREIPFRAMTLPRFLAENLGSLAFTTEIKKTVTLHEICKMGFTGLDVSGPRGLLKALPGVTLKEMPRHGPDTVCCGACLVDFFYDGLEAIRDNRLAEADSTRAEAFVDICHACHELFVPHEAKHPYEIVNYITLAARGLGIEREDKFKKYRQWADLERILADAADNIETSPFSRQRIIEVLDTTFVKGIY